MPDPLSVKLARLLDAMKDAGVVQAIKTCACPTCSGLRARFGADLADIEGAIGALRTLAQGVERLGLLAAPAKEGG